MTDNTAREGSQILGTTEEASEFANLLLQEFKPKTERAREAVETAVRTLAEQALAQTDLVSNDAIKSIESIIAAIDAKRVTAPGEPGRWEIFTHGGRNRTGIDAVAWAAKLAGYGAGEILLTSMDADGTKAGYDLALVRAISDAVDVPVIASGGVGNLQHLADGILEGGADAVLAASIFHFGEYTIPQAKQYLAERGITMRV